MAERGTHTATKSMIKAIPVVRGEQAMRLIQRPIIAPRQPGKVGGENDRRGSKKTCSNANSVAAV